MLSLKKILKANDFRKGHKVQSEKQIEKLQLKMLRIQQGTFHQGHRAIILFEGFDAAGKGGVIRTLTAKLDPRSFRVHPIGPPKPEEQGKHYLYRFWTNLPSPGIIAVFDRSWYGRVLVEKVEGLIPPTRVKDAYREINEFEKTLTDDGIELIKIFLAISKDEQLKRLEERLKDPYKQWKITPNDIKGRAMWDKYVDAVDKMFDRTNTDDSPWHLIPANHKPYARVETLRIITDRLKGIQDWMDEKARLYQVKIMKEALKDLAKISNGG